MKKIEVSEALVALIRKHTNNIEYYIGEALGYISDERGKQLKDCIRIDTGPTLQIEMSDEVCAELQSTFDQSVSLSQAADIVMLCGYLLGGV